MAKDSRQFSVWRTRIKPKEKQELDNLDDNLSRCVESPSWTRSSRAGPCQYVCLVCQLCFKYVYCKVHVLHPGWTEGMAKACCGGRDKTPPVTSRWVQVSHELVFGRKWTSTWGSGGVAFLNPIPHERPPTTLIRMYKITLQQFCDVLAQENHIDPCDSQLTIEWSHINTLRNNLATPAHHTFEFLPGSWYGTIKYLGDEDGLPILTITCSTADMRRYIEKELPVCAPSETYSQVIIKGLLEYGLSEEEARAYVVSRSPPNAP